MHLVDRFRDLVWRLPPATTDYRIHRDVEIPMRDGAVLRGDHYAPQGHAAATVLVRSPYGRRFPWSLEFGTNYASRGYHVVIQSVRGTFGSGGVFDPMVHETDDGADTVAWLRTQPWFNGSLATVGMSYLGYVQWALLREPPRELKAAVIIAGPHDFAEATWGTGAFTLTDFLGWTNMMAHIEDPGRVKAAVRRLTAPRAVARASRALPLGESARALLGDGGGWYESWLSHGSLDDEFWARMRGGEALDRVTIPVLLVGGWRDIFEDQTLAQYRALRERGVDVALTMGPWTHAQVMSRGAPVVAGEALRWLDTHLAGHARRRDEPVHVHVDGVGWRGLPDWPPAMPELVLYPAPHGRFLPKPPTDTATPSTFTYDPADPTPTVGGRLLNGRSVRDDTTLSRRSDVLTFTGEPLTEDTFVLGTPVVELVHSCDNPHRDVFVRVSEVNPSGRSVNVSDGFTRLSPGFASGTVRLELDAVAHRFAAGNRIRLLVAGGSHPRYARNLGTGEDVVDGRSMATATHTVHHGAGGFSRVVLPAGPRPSVLR